MNIKFETVFSKSSLLSAVQKICTSYSNEYGTNKVGHGTGFWLFTKKQNSIFITNRHNIDPSINSNLGNKFCLLTVTILLRAYSYADKHPFGDTHPWTIQPNEFDLFLPTDNSDVVVLLPKHPPPSPNDPDQGIFTFTESQLFYQRSPIILDHLYFIGFPGKARVNAAYDLPIARSCFISSYPLIDYSLEDKSILTSQTCLVEGLSFGGSSGSVVIQEMEKDSPFIMGIMSGHFPGDAWGINHAGLSYLTMGGSISRIISDNDL